MNEHGEAANYQQLARYYDLVMGDRRPYIEFYGGLVRGTDRSLLDVGCGSGTVTAALAEIIWGNAAGRETRIVGLDGSSAMLAEARRCEPRIAWLQGDLRAVNVEGQFDLIISTYNTLQHVDAAGLAQALKAMRAKLALGGRIAFDIYRPNLDYIRIAQRNRLAFRLADEENNPLEVREDTEFSEDAGILNIAWRLIDQQGRVLAHANYNMWQHDPVFVERAISDADLVMVERFGDLDRSTYGPQSKKQVIVCAT